MANQLAFLVDTTRCIGCRTCEIACKDEHSLSVGPRLRYVRDYAGGAWENDAASPGLAIPRGVFSYYVSISCNHCANPACVKACPTGAMGKNNETGVVLNDKEKCIGCSSCIQACPYGAPQLVEEESLTHKCDFCTEIRAMGMAPACVEACPMRALSWGEYEDLVSQYGSASDIMPLPSSEETGPSVVIIPHKDARYNEGEGYSVSLCIEN